MNQVKEDLLENEIDLVSKYIDHFFIRSSFTFL